MKIVKKLICKWINQKEKEFNGSITDDDYFNFIEKRREKESGIKKICEKLFVKLEDISVSQDQVYRQKLGSAGDEEEEEEGEGDGKLQRKVNQAMTDKLKNILSRRTT